MVGTGTGSGIGVGTLYWIVLTVVDTGSGTGGGTLYWIVFTVVGAGSGTGEGTKDCCKLGVYSVVVVVVVVVYSPKLAPASKGVDSKFPKVNPVSTTGLDTTFVTFVSVGIE